MNLFLKINPLLFALLIIIPFSLFSISLAMLEVDWPPSPMGTDLKKECGSLPTSTCNFSVLTKYIYEWGIGLGGLATFISFVIGGFQYITSMGDPAKLADAKDRIKSAFFGLILLLGSFVILNTINPQLLTFTPYNFTGTTTIISYTECNNDQECKIECEKKEDPQKCAKYDFKCDKLDIPNSETSVGYCKREVKKCTFAKLYPSANFGGSPTEIKLNEKKENIEPRSVKAFAGTPQQNEIDLHDTYFPSGGCALNLYAAGSLFWMCGELIGTISAYAPDIAMFGIDKPIKCVQLVRIE